MKEGDESLLCVENVLQASVPAFIVRRIVVVSM